MLASLLVFAAQISGGWVDITPQPDLKGWIQRGGKASYAVEKGVVIGESRPNTPNSFLCTEQVYSDFELEFEVKVDAEMNSGVQFRSNSYPGYRGGAVHGYQAEIDPSERSWSGGLYDESRRGWLQDLSADEAARKAFNRNDWNHYRILAVRESIQIWVNGVRCVDFKDGLSRSGFIGLQVHNVGDRKDPLRVMWRNIRIRELGRFGELPPGGILLLGSGSGEENWHKLGEPTTPIGWEWIEGALQVKPGTGNIISKRTHGAIRAHVEFRVDDNGKTGQANGNSGVFFQNRYEVQILNSAGQEPSLDNCGAIYSVKAPDFNCAYAAGVWQSYDVEFYPARWEGTRKTRDAWMTVYHNGTRIHHMVEVPRNTTTGGSESPEPMGIRLQDHGNLIQFRNIWIRPMD